MEAEYKKYFESDSSEDEEQEKLDEKGKELKKLIKKGAPEYVPPPASPETKNKRKPAEAAPQEDKSTVRVKKPTTHPPEPPRSKAAPPVSTIDRITRVTTTFCLDSGCDDRW